MVSDQGHHFSFLAISRLGSGGSLVLEKSTLPNEGGSPTLTCPVPTSVSRRRLKGYEPEKKQPSWSWLGARVLILALDDFGTWVSTSPPIKWVSIV